VWRAIQAIPYGRVRSYKWVAVRVGGAHYARAVGLALGANPIPIIVPCHRVVAHDGSLGGFSAGLAMKRKLLLLEGTLRRLSRHPTRPSSAVSNGTALQA
jgi:O-6-methylguanine DNA methyltransferase